MKNRYGIETFIIDVTEAGTGEKLLHIFSSKAGDRGRESAWILPEIRGDFGPPTP